MYNVRTEFGQIHGCGATSVAGHFKFLGDKGKAWATVSSEQCDESKVAMKNRKFAVF